MWFELALKQMRTEIMTLMRGQRD